MDNRELREYAKQRVNPEFERLNQVIKFQEKRIDRMKKRQNVKELKHFLQEEQEQLKMLNVIKSSLSDFAKLSVSVADEYNELLKVSQIEVTKLTGALRLVEVNKEMSKRIMLQDAEVYAKTDNVLSSAKS